MRECLGCINKLVTLWVMTSIVGCLALVPICVEEWTFTQIWFEVMSALGSAGLSTGITSSELPSSGKWTLIALMWMGRLELLSAFALLWLPFARKVSRAK